MIDEVEEDGSWEMEVGSRVLPISWRKYDAYMICLINIYEVLKY